MFKLRDIGDIDDIDVSDGSSFYRSPAKSGITVHDNSFKGGSLGCTITPKPIPRTVELTKFERVLSRIKNPFKKAPKYKFVFP